MVNILYLNSWWNVLLQKNLLNTIKLNLEKDVRTDQREEA